MTIQLPPEQSIIDRAIIDELFAVVPEDWTAFIMVVEKRATDGDKVAISILNPDDASGEAEPNQVIRENVDKLVAFLEKENRIWEEITYKAFSTPEGAWKINITVPLPPPATPS